MEGLEISEVSFSYIKSNDIFRIDSNYFLKIFLKQEQQASNHNRKTLSNLECVIKSFGAYSLNNYVEYIEFGVPFIRGINLKNGRIEESNMVYISPNSHKILWKSEVNPKTVLLSTSGTIGEIAIASENLKYPINSNQDIAKIFCNEKLNPYYLYIFLLSKFGQNYLAREARGSVQQHVFLSQIENMNVPCFNNFFTKKIERLVKKSEEFFEKSKLEYSAAENHLLNAMNPTDSNLKFQNNFNIKSYNKSFIKTRRLDAEYYQPKYEKIMQHITSQKHAKLSELVKIKKSIEPGSNSYSEDEKGLPFLRVADYNKFGITAPQKKLSSSFTRENINLIEALKPKKGAILFSKDGSIGEAYCLREDANFITSGAILHLKIKDTKNILPEYLTLVLNSTLVRSQAERDVGGSIILHWRVKEIENALIPIVDMETQAKISTLVEQSFALKSESDRLLEVAKRAVEIAIEENEAAAMVFIENETKHSLQET